jgi:UDP:flavonoid glycosyltransferase YjiC (YdhE family)
MAVESTNSILGKENMHFKILLHSHYHIGYAISMQPVAKALVEHGHDVVWLARPDHESFVRSTGATFIPTREVTAVDAFIEKENPKHPFETYRLLFRNRMLAQVADYRRALKDFPANCLLVDVYPQGAKALYELGEIPVYATLGITPIYTMGARFPQAKSGKPPPTTMLGVLVNRFRHFLNRWVFFPLLLGPIFNEQRQKIGLPNLKWGRTSWYYSQSEFAHIQASSPEIEYLGEPNSQQPSPNTNYCGPLYLSTKETAKLPEWWSKVTSHPCVVAVTQGTVATDPAALIKSTIKALEGSPDILLIVVSRRVDEIRKAMPNLSSNIYLMEWLPYDLLLPQLRILVTNGGWGGVTQALAHGIPMICAGRTEDKSDNGARVAWVGAGINLSATAPSPVAIREAVKSILSDGSYERQAKRLGADLKSLGGGEKVCEVLEKLLAGEKAKV